jgi:hypothetical protein
MIREFQESDLKNFTPNEHSGIDEVLPIFTSPIYHKFSLIEGDITKAIIYFHHTGGDDWAGFFLISKDFSARNGIQIRNFIKQTTDKYKPKRLWTVSLDCPMINKWHKFLRLKEEKSDIILNGKKYIMWSCLWDRSAELVGG